MDAKYIVFDGTPGGLAPIIFPQFINHNDVAQRFRDWQPVSAGFCSVRDDGKVLVGSWSETLKLTPKEHDARLIERALRGF